MLTEETAQRLAAIFARALETFERIEAREVVRLADFILEEGIDLSPQTVFGYLKQYGLPYKGGPHARAVRISRACGRRLLILMPGLKPDARDSSAGGPR